MYVLVTPSHFGGSGSRDLWLDRTAAIILKVPPARPHFILGTPFPKTVNDTVLGNGVPSYQNWGPSVQTHKPGEWGIPHPTPTGTFMAAPIRITHFWNFLDIPNSRFVVTT